MDVLSIAAFLSIQQDVRSNRLSRQQHVRASIVIMVYAGKLLYCSVQ
jgi:hypothetical protein